MSRRSTRVSLSVDMMESRALLTPVGPGPMPPSLNMPSPPVVVSPTSLDTTMVTISFSDIIPIGSAGTGDAGSYGVSYPADVHFFFIDTAVDSSDFAPDQVPLNPFDPTMNPVGGIMDN